MAGNIASLALTSDGTTMWGALNADDGWTGLQAFDLANDQSAGKPYVDDDYTLKSIALSPDDSLAFAVTWRRLLERALCHRHQNFTVVQTIPLSSGANPQDVAVTPDGSMVAVTDWENDAVYSSPHSGRDRTRNIFTISGIHDAQDVVISPDGYTAYVTGSDGVTPIQVTDPSASAGSPVSAGDDPYGIALTADGQYAYVTNETDNGTVTVLQVPSIIPRVQSVTVPAGRPVSTAPSRCVGL